MGKRKIFIDLGKCAVGIIGIIILNACSVKIHPSEKKDENKKEVLSEKDEMSYRYIFSEATGKRLLGEIDQAVILYKEALKINPESDAAMYELSNIYQYLGENELAIQYAENAYKKVNTNLWYGKHLAGLYHITGRKENTIALYEEMCAKNPENIENRYNLASLYRESGKSGKAIELLEGIEKDVGITEMVNMTKYNIFEQEKKYNQAVSELIKLEKAFPEEVKYSGILAETYDEMGKTKEAEEKYRMLLDKYPEHGMAQMSVTSFYRRQELYDKSLEWLERAAENADVGLNEKIQEILFYISQEEVFEKQQKRIEAIIQKIAETHKEDIKVHALLADYNVRTGNYKKAAEILSYVTDQAPELFNIWEQRIIIENTLGNTENVGKVCGEAIKIFPDSAQLFLYKAIAEYQLGNNEHLLETVKKGLRVKGISKGMMIEFLSLQAEALHAIGKDWESDRIFEEVLKLDPDDINTLNNYAYYLSIRRERLDEALEMSGKTIKMEPENMTYLDTYAWILYMKEEYKDALHYISESIRCGGGKDPDILEHYGDILLKNGEKERAVEMWKKSAEYGNKGEQIKKKISEAE